MRMSPSTETKPSTFKAWLTAAEIHVQRLPGLGASERSASYFVAEARGAGPSFLCRKVPGVPAPDHPGGRLRGGFAIHYTRLPLEAIVAYEARHRPEIEGVQPDDRRHARLGSGVIGMAQGGQLRALILQTMVAEPRLPVVGIRDRCIERFGLDVVVIVQGLPTLTPMPPVRTFQAFVRMLRDTGMADVQA